MFEKNENLLIIIREWDKALASGKSPGFDPPSSDVKMRESALVRISYKTYK